MINSRCCRFTVTCLRRYPLSRTYGVILQSSLTTVLPSALDFSSRLPVSVLVRSPVLQPLEDFLGRASNDLEILIALGPLTRIMWADFPIPPPLEGPRTFLFVPLTIHTPSSIGPHSWRRNINLLSIVYAFRPRLRDRLTLGGFTFPRKP